MSSQEDNNNNNNTVASSPASTDVEEENNSVNTHSEPASSSSLSKEALALAHAENEEDVSESSEESEREEDESETNFFSPRVPLSTLNLDGVAEYILRNDCRNIIVMTGAGLSVSAGIPDFRSPGTGLYDNLQKYNLPEPEAVFDLSYFRSHPHAFYHLAKELYPGNFAPTPAHHFIKLLHDQGRLLRNYTQNIDGLERQAGIPGNKLVEAHGTFSTARCIDCKREAIAGEVEHDIFHSAIPTCTACGGYVKPDIVFFGEGLPKRFFDLRRVDFPKCDLLIVMGTSLTVAPFNQLVNDVGPTVPRVLLNLEPAGVCERKITPFEFIQRYGHHFGVSLKALLSELSLSLSLSPSPSPSASGDTNSPNISEAAASPLTETDVGGPEEEEEDSGREKEKETSDDDDDEEEEEEEEEEEYGDLSLSLFSSLSAEDKNRLARIQFTPEMMYHYQRINASRGEGFHFNLPSNKRDVFHKGTCDESVEHLCISLGVLKRFQQTVKEGREMYCKNKQALASRLRVGKGTGSTIEVCPPQEKKEERESYIDSIFASLSSLPDED